MTVTPYARHQLKARWNRLKGREIAGPAIDGRCTKNQRLVADAKGHEIGASPDTKIHESGLLQVPSKSRLERLMVARASTRGHWGHMGRLGRNGGAQDAGAFRVGSCPAKAGFVSDDATTPEGFGMVGATGEAKPQTRARRSCRISSQDDTAHRRL